MIYVIYENKTEGEQEMRFITGIFSNVQKKLSEYQTEEPESNFEVIAYEKD
ncbi:MAG: hypothetical protein IKJ07_10560 [Clostridia bacterium]|nr:hypothetical protein [Clostridia bacterium]MBR4033156.1 hypothetical protein [Clostridia bacterium]